MHEHTQLNMCVCKSLHLCLTLCDALDCSLIDPSAHILGKNTGVACHALLQGIFLTQGSNLCLLCLLHWQAGSLLSHWGSPLYYLYLMWLFIWLYLNFWSCYWFSICLIFSSFPSPHFLPFLEEIDYFFYYSI